MHTLGLAMLLLVADAYTFTVVMCYIAAVHLDMLEVVIRLTDTWTLHVFSSIWSEPLCNVCPESIQYGLQRIIELH